MFDKSLTKFVCYLTNNVVKNLSKFVKNLTSCYILTEKLIDKFFTNFDKFLSKYSMELDLYTLSRVYFYTLGAGHLQAQAIPQTP